MSVLKPKLTFVYLILFRSCDENQAQLAAVKPPPPPPIDTSIVDDCKVLVSQLRDCVDGIEDEFGNIIDGADINNEPESLEAVKANQDLLHDIVSGRDVSLPEHHHSVEVNDNRNIYKPESVSAEECETLISNRKFEWTQEIEDDPESDKEMIRILKINRNYYSGGCPAPRESYKTRNGVPKIPFATPVCVPIKLEKDQNALLQIATYCPDNLTNCLQARKDGTGKVYKENGGKHRHVSSFMHSESDTMVASSIEVLRSCVGTKLFLGQCILMECSPDAKPYRGDLSDVYDDDVAEARQQSYIDTVFLPTIEVAKESNGRIKIQMISEGAKKFVTKALGGKAKLMKLVKQYPSLFLGSDPVTGDVKVHKHPEMFTNTKLFANNIHHQDNCDGLTDAATNQVVHLTGDDSLRSDIGKQFFEKRVGSVGYQAMLEARRKFIERKKERFKNGDDALQHHYYELCLADGFHPDLVDTTNAQSMYMQHLHSLGTHNFQSAAQSRLASRGISVSAKEAMKAEFKHASAPLQLNHLEQCQKRGIVSATASNATSLLESDKMKHNEHNFQLANLERCEELGITDATASNATSLLQINKMNAGDHQLQDYYLKQCQDQGITHDKHGNKVTAKNAFSAVQSSNNVMKNPTVAAANKDTKLKKKLIKHLVDCKSKEEKKDKIMELIAVFECDKCKGKEQIGMIGSEKYCETAGCEHCHKRKNTTGEKNGNGAPLPKPDGKGYSENGQKKSQSNPNPKNPWRKCWVFKRYLKPKEVDTLLDKVEEK